MENKDNRNMEEEMDTASEAKAGEDAACEDSREAEMNPDRKQKLRTAAGIPEKAVRPVALKKITVRIQRNAMLRRMMIRPERRKASSRKRKKIKKKRRLKPKLTNWKTG